MLDMVRGIQGPTPHCDATQLRAGYPVMRSRNGVVTWGVEGIVFSAGTCVQWLCDLGLASLESVHDQSDALASSVVSTDGVDFVPAFSGLGTPRWDFGARGGFFATLPADLAYRPTSFARCSREWYQRWRRSSRSRGKRSRDSPGRGSSGWMAG